MLFSILIANYNNGKYFRDCYNSLVSQTHSNWEAIIVDDNSTDDSVAVIKGLIKQDSRFRFFVNDRNYGCGYTKNRCASLARGEICAFLDPDDALCLEALELVVDCFSSVPNISMLHSTHFFCDEDLTRQGIYERAGEAITDEQFTNLDGKVTAFACFNRSSYLKTEGIDINLKRAVDQDLYLKLSEVGPFYFLNKPLYEYRIHNGGIASNNEYEALYYHIKALIKAEERRGVSFEKAFTEKIKSFFGTCIDAENLKNPLYLIRKLITVFKSSLTVVLKKLFRKSSSPSSYSKSN